MTEGQKEEREGVPKDAFPLCCGSILYCDDDHMGKTADDECRMAAVEPAEWHIQCCLLSLCIKKLLERIKVCIESIMMMLLPWDKKGGVQQNY